MTRHATHGRERGFALLIVLWALVLAAWLVGQLAQGGGTEARIAANLRAAAAREMQADGAIHRAAFALLDGRAPDTSVTVRDQSALVNLATAPAELVAALLAACGAPQAQAEEGARAIVAARAAQPLRSLGDLARIGGLDPSLRARLLGHVTLYSEYGPDPRTADPVVAEALAAARRAGAVLPDDAPFGHARVVALRAAEGGFVRRAVLRLSPDDPRAPLAILAWETGQTGAGDAVGSAAGTDWPR